MHLLLLWKKRFNYLIFNQQQKNPFSNNSRLSWWKCWSRSLLVNRWLTEVWTVPSSYIACATCVLLNRSNGVEGGARPQGESWVRVMVIWMWWAEWNVARGRWKEVLINHSHLKSVLRNFLRYNESKINIVYRLKDAWLIAIFFSMIPSKTFLTGNALRCRVNKELRHCYWFSD